VWFVEIVCLKKIGEFLTPPYQNSYVRQVNKNDPPRFGTNTGSGSSYGSTKCLCESAPKIALN
jgi:hypothetical protein